jgi:hypothetical protein
MSDQRAAQLTFTRQYLALQPGEVGFVIFFTSQLHYSQHYFIDWFLNAISTSKQTNFG